MFGSSYSFGKLHSVLFKVFDISKPSAPSPVTLPNLCSPIALQSLGPPMVDTHHIETLAIDSASVGEEANVVVQETKDVVLVMPSGSTVHTWPSVPVGTRYSDLLRQVPSLPVDYHVLRGTDTVHPLLHTSPKTISFADLAQVTLTLVISDRSFVAVLMAGIPIGNEHVFFELPELACCVEVGPFDKNIKAEGVLAEMAERSETGGPLARRMCGDLKRFARAP